MLPLGKREEAGWAGTRLAVEACIEKLLDLVAVPDTDAIISVRNSFRGHSDVDELPHLIEMNETVRIRIQYDAP